MICRLVPAVVLMLLSQRTAAMTLAQSPPAVQAPVLAIERLPPAIRQTVQRAIDAVRTQPADAVAAGRLAMLLHAHEQYGLAAYYYGVASRLAPHSLRWTYLTGVVQSQLGDHAAAIAAFRRALAADARMLPARLRLAESLLVHGHLTASRAEFEQILDRFPEFALAHYGLGRVAAALDDKRGAVGHVQQAVDLASQFGAAHYALALAFRRGNEQDHATRHFDVYRRIGPLQPGIDDPLLEEVRSLVGTARELIASGTRAAADGRLEDAIRLHLKAIDADSGAAQAHVNLISLFGRLGRAQEAERHYREARRLGRHLGDAHYNYGVLLASAGNDAGAADAFRRTLAVDPFHARAQNNLGALAAQQQRSDEAVRHYRQALASDPQHKAARFGLGRVLMMAGRPADAIEHFNRLLDSAGPDSPRYRSALAGAHFAAGDLVRASQEAERALRDANRLGLSELAASIEETLKGMQGGR